MIFAGLYKSPKSPLSRLRHAHYPPLPAQPLDYDPDLVSRDKTKQKEAVKRHLRSKVLNDWDFTWPPAQEGPHGPAPKINGPQPETSTWTEGPTASEELEGFLEIASEDPDIITPVADGETAPDSGDEAGSEAVSVYSTVSEDVPHYQYRQEWASELSEGELPYNSGSPFKFDSPDSVGKAVQATRIARKARRWRELRNEMLWNDGLACFEARRNAWTVARIARVRPKPQSPASPSSPRRGLFWRSHSHTSSASGQTMQASPPTTSPLSLINTNRSQHLAHIHHDQADLSPVPTASPDSENSQTSQNILSPKSSRSSESRARQSQPQTPLPVEILLPVAPPLLPPANPMRASITPAIYISIYDKVVVHSLQPACPINLADMTRACVAGWKRDGEWPPRPTEVPAASVVAVRRKKPTASGTGAKYHQAIGVSHPGAGDDAGAGQSPATAAFAGVMGGGGGGGGTRRMSLSFLTGAGKSENREKDKGGGEARRESVGDGGLGTGKAIRRSLQKVLGLSHGPGQHPSPSVGTVLNTNGENPHGNDG